MINKKVLVINSKAPYPLHTGGEMRTYQMIKLLSETFEEVDIVYLTNDENPETKKGIDPYCKNSYAFQLSSKLFVLLRTLIGFLFGKLPLQVYYFYSPKIQKWIDANIEKYDLVFCNNIRTAEYVRNKSDVKKVIDYVDAISMNYERAKNKSNGIWKFLYSIDYKRSLNYELDILRKFNKTIIISEIDASYIISSSKEKNVSIAVISNMVEIPPFVKEDYEEEEKSVVFVGAMYYEANVAAVVYFAEKVFDKIKKVYPDLKFYIVGSRPHAKVQKLAKMQGVVVTGFIEDVSEYFTKPSIFVAPMQTGAGVQNKILQAMAAGCPVVTTTIGAEGIENITEKELIVKDNPKEMAEAIVELLTNSEKRKQQAICARKYILENLSHEHILNQFKQIVSF